MTTIYYPAIFHKDNEKGYWVEFSDLPGCFTQGDTIEQAYQFAQEALKLYLDDNFKKPIPIESDSKEMVVLIPYVERGDNHEGFHQ